MAQELPLVDYLMGGHVMGIADGPTEVHKITIAKQVLAKYKPATSQEEINFTPYNRHTLKRRALEKYGPALRAAGVELRWVGRGPGLSTILAKPKL